MVFVQLTKLYPTVGHTLRNFAQSFALLKSVAATTCGKNVSLLRSRLGHLVSGEIPERFSSSLPSLFASGRFATFLSSVR